MSVSDILTFSAPDMEIPKVDAMPSPTLELAYACYALTRPDSAQRTNELPWLKTLYTKHGNLIEAIQAFWPEDQRSEAGGDLFMIVGDLGYARDQDVDRLFAEFGKIPQLLIKRGESYRKKFQAYEDKGKREHELKSLEGMLERAEMLKQPEVRKRYLALLKQLWKVLEPIWKEEGYAESKRASEAFLNKYRETGNVLDAIPAHHFTQFEASQKHIQTSLEKGKLLVVPLFFAAAGGFSFDFADSHYIGYGIQSEHLFEKLLTQVEKVAPKMKALSDPTRLMMLTLIARYENFVLTVGDLATQLGVTQPTASGHLKLLKEAGLVALKKHGNKSFYHVNSDAIKQAIAEISDLVLRPK